MRSFNFKETKFYKMLHKDIKEFNGILLSLFCISILVGAGLLSYKINTSYALFTDVIEGEKTIEVSVGVPQDKSGANVPVLSDNMIPVYYDETCNSNAGCWKKADSENMSSEYKWYDYDSKMWANSVTVSATSTATKLTLDDGSTTSCAGSTCTRNDYKNAEHGTIIPMSDILTMLVWIPRYKYEVWNFNYVGSSVSSNRQIDITFEEGTESTGDITCTPSASATDGSLSETCKVDGQTCTDSLCNGKTYTHPAFTFGNSELKGLWMGKFELSPHSSSTCYTTKNETNCNKTGISLLSKPDTISYMYADYSRLFYNVAAMNDSGNIHGFTSSDDTHMIKNMEWGAVAYLSNSKYGLCTEGTCGRVYKNNSSSFYSGRCGTTPDTTTTVAAGNYVYNNIGYGTNASTTHNIYGIYDMSGGAGDKMMTTVVGPSSSYVVGVYSTDTSGFAGVIYNDGKYTSVSGLQWPDRKYYDSYSYSFTSRGASSVRRGLLGDATKEVLSNLSSVYSWHNTYVYLPTIDIPFSTRGGNSSSSSLASIYAMGSRNGVAGQEGTRLIVSIVE